MFGFCHTVFIWPSSLLCTFIGTDIESASEVEDSGVSLHSVTKEQLFQYFRKMQRRSEKYKSKFTQIYQVYRDLERERDKLRVS